MEALRRMCKRQWEWRSRDTRLTTRLMCPLFLPLCLWLDLNKHCWSLFKHSCTDNTAFLIYLNTTFMLNTLSCKTNPAPGCGQEESSDCRSLSKIVLIGDYHQNAASSKCTCLCHWNINDDGGRCLTPQGHAFDGGTNYSLTPDYTPACPGPFSVPVVLILHLLCVGSLSMLRHPPHPPPHGIRQKKHSFFLFWTHCGWHISGVTSIKPQIRSQNRTAWLNTNQCNFLYWLLKQIKPPYWLFKSKKNSCEHL